LTSTSARFKRTFLTIESIFRQSTKPDKILLWLPKELSRTDLPNQLLKLEKRGLSIQFVKDIGPVTKMFYTLKKFSGAITVTADDDNFYPRHWLRDLYFAHNREPNLIHCHAAKYMTINDQGKLNPVDRWISLFEPMQGASHNLLPLSGSGCIFPKNCFNDEVFNEELFLALCPKHDDVWWKAMAIRNNRLCKRVKPISKLPIQIRNTQSTALVKHNVDRGGYDVQNRAVFDHFKLHSKLSR
jgi:hypothetical protein